MQLAARREEPRVELLALPEVVRGQRPEARQQHLAVPDRGAQVGLHAALRHPCLRDQRARRWHVVRELRVRDASAERLQRLAGLRRARGELLYRLDDNNKLLIRNSLLQLILELGQIVSISKYPGTTRCRYRTFKVSKYRLTWMVHF